MKKSIILAASFLILSSITVFAQNKVIEHKVGKGDTVTSIARKYNVTPSDIYRLNPDAIKGVNLDAIIKIPVANTKTASSVKKHIVLEKENIYSIARKYDVRPADIKAANKEVLKEVLKPGVVLVIPVKTNGAVSLPVVTDSNSQAKKSWTSVTKNPIKNTYHIVSPKETKFGIAKQYGLTVEELESLNPDIKGSDTIEVGFVLRLTDTVPVYVSSKTTAVIYNDYEIQPQETLFSLTQKSGLTEDEFLKLNPNLKTGVLAGAVIKMPNNTQPNLQANKQLVDLSKNVNKQVSKNLVLLLPFNADKVGVSQTITVQDQLKNDKFLNMTLDFYAGALVAIDSAKKMGLPIKVQVLDSKENKTSSNVVSLYNNGSFAKADAVVGPFFQNHVETLASKLEEKQIPVVSPLSNEKGKAIDNLYQSMPNANDLKQKVVDYMSISNGNIIAVVDPKKGSARKYITESFPEVKIAPMLETGTIDASQFKQLLDKNRTNFVILQTESTNLILNTCKTLVAQATDYPIQLVSLDKNETLESEEISLTDLMKLKFLYPSVTRDVSPLETTSFAKTFKKYNGVMPNKFATRGFDVTFDTILRLFNQEGFEATITKASSEQIENKFNYTNVDGAYHNQGVYLLYHDNDLTIKEVN